MRHVSGRNDFVEIMEMLDKRLNDKGKNWRHVFKVRDPYRIMMYTGLMLYVFYRP